MFDRVNAPFAKITYFDLHLLPLWSSLSDLSEGLSSGLQSSFFTPPKNLTHTLNVVHLFLVDLLIDAAYIKGLFLDD